MLLKTIKTVIKNYMTSADGVTYAIGRGYSVPLMVVGLSIPPAMLLMGQAISLVDLGIYLGALVTAVTILISGTNMTEPKVDGESK